MGAAGVHCFMTPDWMKGVTIPKTKMRHGRFRPDCPVCSVLMTRIRAPMFNGRIFGCRHCKGWLCMPACKEMNSMLAGR